MSDATATSSLAGITVNGVPLEEIVSRQHPKRIYKERVKVVPGRTIYQNGQKETHILIKDLVFPWHQKAPFVASELSVLGAIEYNQAEDKLKCHECGEWHGSLSKHIRAHKISAQDYKKKHGLSQTTSLITKTLSDKIKSRLTNPQRAILGPKKGPPRGGVHRGGVPKGRVLSPEISNLRGKCRAQLTQKIHDISRQLGRTPTDLELRAKIGNPETIELVFGAKMREIYESLGLKPRKAGLGISQREMTRGQIAICLLDLSRRLGRTPTLDEISKQVLSRRSIERAFGMKLRDALIACGIPPRKYRSRLRTSSPAQSAQV